MDGKQLKYNWFITDAQNCHIKSPYYELFSENPYCFISGEELTKIENDENAQWIFGVLSAIPKDVPLEEVLKYEYPYANGYTGFWKNPITMQHPHAVIEIVPWDGELILVISSDEDLIEKIHQKIPNAIDLYEDNIRVQKIREEQEKKENKERFIQKLFHLFRRIRPR
ncbi:MAG: hypothetical protein Q4A75_09845 [Peptostreptococcaceae bacterium]|nr:hypothetical protein [Peptostreptococcaceae bacterium]